MTDRRGTEDKQVTVAVTFGVISDIATVTVTGSDCTGDNKTKFMRTNISELYRECKARCEEANRSFVRFAM
jgi:hypothetical protein